MIFKKILITGLALMGLASTANAELQSVKFTPEEKVNDGWKAFLDGKKIDHYRVNYLLRAVNVPAGLHRLHFVFKPDSVRIGNVIATIFIILMYASILLAIGYGICKSKNYDFRRLLHK